MSVASASPVSGPVAKTTGRASGMAVDLAVLDADARVRFDPAGHLGAEDVAVDGERAAGGHPGHLAGRHHQRAGAAHLFLEQADRVPERGAAEGVAAHELGQPIAVLGGRALLGLLLDQRHLDAPLGELPRALAPGQPATDDGHFLAHVGRTVAGRSVPGRQPESRPAGALVAVMNPCVVGRCGAGRVLARAERKGSPRSWSAFSPRRRRGPSGGPDRRPPSAGPR